MKEPIMAYFVVLCQQVSVRNKEENTKIKNDHVAGELAYSHSPDIVITPNAIKICLS
jgi:hypothetical protein